MAPATASKKHDSLASFSPIRLSTLESLDRIDSDLYIVEGQQVPTLYRSKGLPASEMDFSKLRKSGIDTLYVRQQDALLLQKRLRKNLESIVKDEEISGHDRFGLLQMAVSAEIEQAFRMINVDSAVERSAEIGNIVTDLLRGHNALMSDLFGVVRHDFYTFTHLTNVSGYAVLIAESMGIDNEDELKEIATGTLLHDLGKRLISPSILNKPGRLSESEWAIIKSHPQKGYEELHDREELSFGQLMMVYQHHEKLDGSGYPVGITADDMHPWAKLCAVVDIFDAMTCKRPYRKPLELHVVLDHLLGMAGKQLDKDIVECLVSTMQATK